MPGTTIETAYIDKIRNVILILMTRAILTFLTSLILLTGVFAQSKEIDNLERKLGNATDTARVNILNELSGLYASTNLIRADSLANEAMVSLRGLDFVAGQIKNYNHLSFIKASQGQFENGAKYSKKAIELSEQLGNKRILAESYDNLFIILFQKGDNVEAKNAAEKCLEFAEASGSIRLIAKAYDNLGILDGIKGKHAEAIEYFMKSLQYNEDLGDDAKISISLLHLGHTFELAGNLKKALEYLERSLEVNKNNGNKYNEGWSLVNIGVVYSRLNQADTALAYYEKALALAEELNNQRLILTCLDNIGGKYSLKGDFDKSNYYLQKAYRLSEASGTNSRTVYIAGNLAENYLFMGQFDSARIFGEKQLGLALSSELISEQKVAYYNLAQIYDSLGDYQSAYASLLKYIAVNDTIFSRQKSEQIEALRESFETERKEQEIFSLKTINETQRFKNRTYAAAAISFLIFGSMLFYVQRQRAKRNRLLLQKERELDQMKSRFFANISHEFRTPLTLILGPLDDLITKIEHVDIKKQLKVMQRNAGRLLDLVNQLLDLSKIESGKLKLDTSKSDIIAIIRGVSMSFHSMAEQKHIGLALDILPESLEMNFDREKFETILINLLSNAFKFTPDHGNIIIYARIIQTGSGSRGTDYFRISVADNGKGIPEADVGLIFDRFYQSDTNQLLQQEGSGIGLALTKELVELHRGTIRAESKIGKGTEIIVDLPIDLPMVVNAPTQEEVSIVKEAARAHEHVEAREDDIEMTLNGCPVVLVIEDHDDVRNYIQEILSKRFTIVSAKDGEEGISKAMEIIPDLIISDVMMPKKDGFEVCNALKNDEKTSHIPIVLLTAKSDSEDKMAGLMTRADDYLTKPFVPRELLVRTENLIASRKLLREKYTKKGVIRPKDIAINSIDEKFLNRLIEVVELHMGDEKFGVEELGNEIGMSRSQLHRKLTALLGQRPNQFIRSFRLQRAHDLLKQNSATASEIAYQVGFSSPSYFTKCFHEQFGYTPSEVPA